MIVVRSNYVMIYEILKVEGWLLTTLIAIEYPRHAYQIDWHSKFSVGLDVDRLRSVQP